MLVEDSLTGFVHEIPDDALYGLGYADDVVYDQFGNPVGFPALAPFLAALGPIAAKLVPAVLPGLMSAFTSGFKGYEDGPYGYVDESDLFYGYDGWGYGDDWDPYGAYPAAPPTQVVYDGFGNPVGFGPLASLIPAAARALAPVARTAVQALMPVARSAMTSATRALTQAPAQMVRALMPAAQAATQAATGALRSMIPVHHAPAFPIPRVPMPFPRRPPPGWMRRPVPYTGPGPQRVYMRCSTWPGPAGLVPTRPGLPGVPTLPVGPVAPAPAPMRRRRRRRRRR